MFRKCASDLPQVAVKKETKMPRPKQLSIILTSYFYRKKLKLSVSLMRGSKGEGNRTSETVQVSHVMWWEFLSGPCSIMAPLDTAGVSTQLLENQLLNHCTWPVHHPSLTLIAGHETEDCSSSSHMTLCTVTTVFMLTHGHKMP